MRTIIIAGILLLLGVATPSYLLLSGSTEVNVELPRYRLTEGTSPRISAVGWLLFDAQTGEELGGMGHEDVRPIASVTKLMTAEVALGRFDLSSTTRISTAAVATEGRAGRLEAGETLESRELLFPLLIESSNDAAEAIAEYAGKVAFIESMNERAHELRMSSTVFKDPSGLSEGNTATPRDLKKLLLHLMVEHRHVLDVTKLREYIGESHTWRSNNPAVTLPDFVGGKHGYTPEAGATLAAVFTTTLKNGVSRDIGVVLLGSEDLKADIEVVRTYVSSYVSYE